MTSSRLIPILSWVALAIGLLPISAGELTISDLETGERNGLFWPLDRWGDWLRGSETFRIDRKLVDDAAQGQRAVVTTARPNADGQAAGWYLTGMRVDGSEWRGLEGIRFHCKASRARQIKLFLYYTDDVWGGKKLIASQTFEVGSTWQSVNLPFAEMTHFENTPAKAAPEQIRAMAWIVEKEPDDLWIDDVRVTLPDEQVAAVLRNRLQQRLAVVKRQLRILGGRGLRPAIEPERLTDVTATEDMEAATGRIADSERIVRGMFSLLSYRNRIYHYHDKLKGLVQHGLTEAGTHYPEARELSHKVEVCARQLAADPEQKQTAAEIDALGDDVDAFWLSLQPLLKQAPAATRPTQRQDAWLRPGGRLIVPFAPHSMRTMFLDEKGWRGPREDDYRRMSEWGFNGTRLEVKYHLLEPQRGSFSADYLKMLHKVMDWCDTYGLYVIIDLHWPYPDWFYRGPEGYENASREEQNPYQNPEPLVHTFARLAEELAPHSNILAWEIPTNEPSISSIEIWDVEGNAPSIVDIPWLMHDWNQWLKTTYGSRAALDAHWRQTTHDPEGNGLHESETWAEDAIMPPGHFGVPKQHCRRSYDYMTWAVGYHTELCGRIAETIRKVIPGAVMQQQRMAGGGRWERDAIPVDFGCWQQSHQPGVQVGTHYGVGNSCAYLSPLNMPSANSEEQATGRQGIYARQRARNQGACPFVYFPVKHGFCDWRHNLLESASWMTATADFWDSAWRRRTPEVLVIENSRTAALGGVPSGAELRLLLERMDVDYDLAASHYVAANPRLLDAYKCITMAMSYADPACLETLVNSSKPAFLFGGIGPDVTARFGPGDLADQCIEKGILLKQRPRTWADQAQASTLDLSGNWRFKTDPDGQGTEHGWHTEAMDDSAWETQATPAYWENDGVLHKGREYDGVAWYRTTATIPASWAGCDVVLELGAVDDLDTTYVNGQKVGATDETTPQYWSCPRSYPVPQDLIQFGQPNSIAVRVTDLRGNGGIWRAPVRLVLPNANGVTFTPLFGAEESGQTIALTVPADAPHIASRDLCDDAEVLAVFSADASPALARQGTLWWWLAADTLKQDSVVDNQVLAAFLRAADTAAVWPVTPESANLETYEYQTGQITVYNASHDTVDATLNTDHVLLDMEGFATRQTVSAAGVSTVPIRAPYASNASFFRRLPVRVRPTNGEPVTLLSQTVQQRPGANVITLEIEGTGCTATAYAPSTMQNPPKALLDGAPCDARHIRFRDLVVTVPAGTHTLSLILPTGAAPPDSH